MPKLIELLERVREVGITPKQLAKELGISEESVLQELQEQALRGKVCRIGRGLWILSKYRNLESLPGFRSSKYYDELFSRKYGITPEPFPITINASPNLSEPIHRWSHIIQGFSSNFVNSMLDKYGLSTGSLVFDPFLGSGTVCVCAKLRSIDSIGIDLMPLMIFISRVKLEYQIDPETAERNLEFILKRLRSNWDPDIKPPDFLENQSQFSPEILRDLLKLKQLINELEDSKIRDLFKLGFMNILVKSSNLKRSPCLGYVKKNHPENAVELYFSDEVSKMIQDLKWIRGLDLKARSEVIQGDSREIACPEPADLIITSPPYMNGLDYVINYKIEMAWLDLVKSYSELSELKDRLVVCDNVSRECVRKFKIEEIYSSEIIAEVSERIERNIKDKRAYRRNDMHLIVRKYFHDIHRALEKMYDSLKDRARALIVLGDSLIAGVYVPTDLIVAEMGAEMGFRPEAIKIARWRFSGQRRNFRLRESLIVLRK